MFDSFQNNFASSFKLTLLHYLHGIILAAYVQNTYQALGYFHPILRHIRRWRVFSTRPELLFGVFVAIFARRWIF